MILCVGLSPTVQRTLRLPGKLRAGEVNRAQEVLVTASGKGVNVARVLTTLGAEARLIHILGGGSGRWLSDTLDADTILHDPVWSYDDAPTRTCTTILPEDGPATELVEEAAPVEPHDATLVKAAIINGLFDARAVCLSGSLPQGIPAELYARIVEEANVLGTPVLVDAQKTPLKLALSERPFLVKPNVEEAAATLDLPLTGNAQNDAQNAVAALTDAGAQWALVSMGKDGSLLGNGTQLWQIIPPRVEAVNPIGSGDSLAAGFLVAYIERGLPVPEACAFGTAVAAANCLTPTSGVVRPADVDELLPQVQLTPLH